jgi:hypothetical protein
LTFGGIDYIKSAGVCQPRRKPLTHDSNEAGFVEIPGHIKVNRASADDAHFMAGILNREGTTSGTKVRQNEDGNLSLLWE